MTSKPTVQNTTNSSRAELLLQKGILLILLLVPFHALVTTWLGASFGYLDVFRLWKEVLILGLAALAVAVLVRRPHSRAFFNDTIIRLSICYILLHFTLGAIALGTGQVSREALLFGWILNLRFLVLFGLAWFIGSLQDTSNTFRFKVLLWPAVTVVVFGLLQLLILPADVLTRVGYGPETIQAVYMVDQKPEYQRLQSSLRGPNNLGAYMVMVLGAIWALVVRRKDRRLPLLLFGLASGVVLLFTYSRSAWIGAAAALTLLTYWLIQSARIRKLLLVGLGAAIIIGAVGVWALRDNDTVQNTLFHTDESSQSTESSNEARAKYIERGINDVVTEPFGRGPGTAGPASFRNTEQPTRLAENYYIQLAQEVGIVGLGLFAAITILVARRLWNRRHDTFALVLLASLIGLTVVNMLLHGWADDTVSLLWWGLAGLTFASHHSAHEQSS